MFLLRMVDDIEVEIFSLRSHEKRNRMVRIRP